MDHPTDDDVWHVQLRSGDVCMMTLDLLDDAYQDGLIHEGSLLWKEGNPEWLTLAEVAGLGSEPEPSTSYAPPSSGYSQTPPPYSMGPLSTAPVAADVGEMDFDLEAVSFRPRKRFSMRWLVAAALVGAAAFGFTRRGAVVSALHLPKMGVGSLSNAAGAMIAAPTPPPAAPPVATPVVAPPPVPTPAAVVPTESRLSDDTKRALEEADKKLAAKQQLKQKQVQSRTVDRPKAKLKSENPFHKGGNKFDPLNASL